MRKMWIVVVMIATIMASLYGIINAWEVQAESADDWEEYIETVCSEYNICPELVYAIIERESNWNPKIKNDGCVGLMQISPIFHHGRMKRLGAAKLEDPYDNILVGVDYLSELFNRYHDIYAVLMFYNAGYSSKYGLNAWENGIFSDYAIEVSARAEQLERMNEK